MGKKNKKKVNSSAAQIVPKEQPIKVDTPEALADAVAKVEASSSEGEFNKNKEALLKALNDEVGRCEAQKAQAESARDMAVLARLKAEDEKNALKIECNNLVQEKKKLIGEKGAIQFEYDEAVKTIGSAKGEAEKIKKEASDLAEKTKNDAQAKADEIIENANKEKLSAIASMKLEAAKAWEDECDRLKEEFANAAKDRVDAANALHAIEREKEEFNIEKEVFEDEKQFVASQKAKYIACNPGALENLKLQLEAQKALYENLKNQYESLRTMFVDNQSLMDTLSINLKDASGAERTVSLKEAAPEINHQLHRYCELKEVYGRYQNIRDIEDLEKKAGQVDALKSDYEQLKLECDYFKGQNAAAARTSRELEIMRREVEATDALNKHLIQELESHKMALESRTGDVCPALTNVDAEAGSEDFKRDVEKILRTRQLRNLKEVVAHVKNYAGCEGGSDKERLFYKDDDIRAFLSGMAVSRLIILQGMSGTGKSSLPRIFAESISGFNKLIPVESSWRDRNELLGYYNDFNKKFNAKGFTIELYRSGKELCSQIPTFIVLDEMNLARIEYYFSDFLAVLQKPDPNDWIIDLVASDMRTLPMELSQEVLNKIKTKSPDAYEIWGRIQKSRQGDTTAVVGDMDKQKLFAVLATERSLVGACDLIDGRKIRVPKNVWFIGTANKDESTFEISDKVYDRAQVVSLNDRSEDEGNYKAKPKSFISIDNLQNLFEAAKTSLTPEEAKDVEDRLKKLEDVLKANFDMAFGNRIFNQAKDFVAVFKAAGGEIVDALDYQISTKIWRKIESCDVEIDAFDSLQEVVKDYKATAKLLNKKLRTL